MGKKVLFIAPPYMNLYKDLIDEMGKQGYSVDYIKEIVHPEDPDNVRGYRGLKRIIVVNRERFQKKNRKFWMNLLSSEPYCKTYDILFVLNGQSLSPVVFHILKERNPELYCVNYMFDTTKGVYHFENNFPYFNKIASFDKEDSQKYGLHLLPIFWTEQDSLNIEFEFFGMGAYKKNRYTLYNMIKQYADKMNLSYYLKMYNPVKKRLFFKTAIRNLFKIQQDMISYDEYKSDLITNEILPLSEFNKMLNASKIIVDSNAPHQDGLTSRFMQSLGNLKKIITTNVSSKEYSFYSPSQIFVVDNLHTFSQNKLMDFVNTKIELSDEKLNIIESIGVR